MLRGLWGAQNDERRLRKEAPGERDLTGYDAIVIMIGLSDDARLTPDAAWRKDLTRLLDEVCPRSKWSAQIVVAGIQPVRSITAFDSLLGGIANRMRPG